MTKALFLLEPGPYETIYGEELAREIARLVELGAPPQTAASVRANPGVLREVEVILSGWGAPRMDAAFLEAAPRLKAVLYGAGSVRGFVTEALWQRRIVVTSAAALNAVPVAEFTLSQILFALKRGWLHAADVKRHGLNPPVLHPVPGGYHSKVGIVSLGVIGRRVCELLRPFELEVYAFDPFVADEVLAGLGARRATLAEIFETCDVVSLHTPNLPSTRGMLTGAHFAKMKPNATFINTARGDVIREPEMADALARRPDLWAVLDVLAELDSSAQARLLALPNVVVTPHIAGAMGPECRRLGRAMLEELQRYLRGEPFRWQVTRESLALTA